MSGDELAPVSDGERCCWDASAKGCPFHGPASPAPTQAPQADETLAADDSQQTALRHVIECAIARSPEKPDGFLGEDITRAVLDWLATHVRTIRAEREDGEGLALTEAELTELRDSLAQSTHKREFYVLDTITEILADRANRIATIRADAEQAAARAALLSAAEATTAPMSMATAAWLRERAEGLS